MPELVAVGAAARDRRNEDGKSRTGTKGLNSLPVPLLQSTRHDSATSASLSKLDSTDIVTTPHAHDCERIQLLALVRPDRAPHR